MVVNFDRKGSKSFTFFFNDTATTEIYTLSLHDALPIFDVVEPGVVVRLADPDGVRGGVEAMTRLLHRGPDVDAVVCHNDAVASGALSTLLRRGARVPEDVVVIGRGDTETTASNITFYCLFELYTARHLQAQLPYPLQKFRNLL